VKGSLAKSLYTPEWDYLCDMLTQIRVEQGVTQVELASRLGQPQSFVCKVESGQRKLDLRQFVIYVRCLNGSPVDVLAAFMEAFPSER
jgi:predicted transcriptional regulator